MAMKNKTDKQIKHDVVNELMWDTRTWDQKIDVSVTNGVVVLGGVVASYGQKQAAEAAAHRIAGVLDVANELFVKPKRLYSDVQLAVAVRNALEWDVLVPDDQIISTVTDGWVKLEGKVASLAQRSDAEWAVERLFGVAGVINELTVAALPTTTDSAQLRDSIEAALERRADREADRLRIEVHDGEVSLSGRVHSRPEEEAVVGSISHAPGVQKIHNNLRIDPYF